MKAVVFSVAALLTALVALSYMSSERHSFASSALRLNKNCPEELAVACAGNIQMTERDCAEVTKNPADLASELACVKDLLADKKACWSCICEVTKKYVDLKDCQSA